MPRDIAYTVPEHSWFPQNLVAIRHLRPCLLKHVPALRSESLASVPPQVSLLSWKAELPLGVSVLPSCAPSCPSSCMVVEEEEEEEVGGPHPHRLHHHLLRDGRCTPSK